MLTVFSEVCHYTRIRSPFDRHIVKYANSDPRGPSIKIPFELLDNARLLLMISIQLLSHHSRPQTKLNKCFSNEKCPTIIFGQFHQVLGKGNNRLISIFAEFKIEKFPLMEWNTPVVNLANTITLFASATSKARG